LLLIYKMAASSNAANFIYNRLYKNGYIKPLYRAFFSSIIRILKGLAKRATYFWCHNAYFWCHNERGLPTFGATTQKPH